MNRRDYPAGGGALVVAGAAATYFGLRNMGSREEYNASVAAARTVSTQAPGISDLIR